MVDSTGIQLRPGGCLFALSPIDWLGRHIVRLQVAEYPRSINYGGQYLLELQRGPDGWRVTRVDIGWQN